MRINDGWEKEIGLDLPADGDVDGADPALFAEGFTGGVMTSSDLEAFAGNFGMP